MIIIVLLERRRSFYDNYPTGERHFGQPFGGHPSHMHHYGSGGQPDDSLEPDTTRTLFVGNIPRGISVYELRDYFIRFGHILVRKTKPVKVLYICNITLGC